MENSFFQSLIAWQPWEEMSYKVQRPFPSALGAPAVAAGDALPGPAWGGARGALRSLCPASLGRTQGCRLPPALPSPLRGRVLGLPTSAHIPMQGLRCCELSWTPGSSQGLECPCASTPRSAAVPARIPPHPSGPRAGGAAAPGTLWIHPPGGAAGRLPPHGASCSRRWPWAAGAKAQMPPHRLPRRCHLRARGCQAGGAAAPPGPGALQQGRMPCPPTRGPQGSGGCVGRGPGPCREEGSGGGLAACLPSSLCEVVGPLSPLRAIGQASAATSPDPVSPGLGLPLPWDTVVFV